MDDEPNIRWTMSELLKREGYDALTACDFESAISALDNNAIDAALIDIVLPSKSGIEILKTLQGREPYVPVIMVTGEPNISQMPEIVRAGAYDFLSKPVLKDALINAVSRAVAHKRLQDEKSKLEQQLKQHAKQLELTVSERTHELAEAHNFLNTVLDSSTQHAIIALDTRGLIMLFNRGAEIMLGYSAREAMGSDPRNLLGSEADRAESPFHKWAQQALDEGRHKDEVELRRANEERFTASLTITPIHEQGGPLLGYLCIVNDLTEERRNQERLRQMSARLAHHEKIAALGRMAAQVAHEVKNPLAGLRLYSLHLKSKVAGKIPAPEETLVDRIIDGINQLSETCEQVLSFARPITLTPRPTDVNRIVTDSLSLVEPQLSAKSIEVELSLCEAGAGGSLDEASLRSTLTNLMLNSIQAMSPHGKLGVSTSTSGEYIIVSIADTGCGMSEEQIKHMFDPFYTTKAQGLGLGLFFVSTVIEQHGGSISVDSGIDRGTTITIKLPFEARKRSEATG